ncbi:hypothetical protein, conserved [Entamoeba dispar SAW760]|uniref:Uncharacterized protein n=1 Tax=Entamoeba dispar (strain ATCC PRA-260 / SAW760) TaxID=370354 RepID=B0ERS7_ENTDS|nr:uncharacterized protein EDI_336210 [Entamoeba dispar SAW760]EDR22722.1 hypothetical protein, conserved [Entamoeba dispar SAW760]|eukprot:EDR22722.1 hypothetical protein, conserved [Entamoeba dispar SAW760]
MSQMDQPIFYNDEFILALNRNDLNMAYHILRNSYQIIYEVIQSTTPKSVAELNTKINENTKTVTQMCENAKTETAKLMQQIEEQEKSIPDLQQMYELTQRQLAERTIILKNQVKLQKDDNAQLKAMYNKIQSSQEDEFNQILEEAQKPLELQVEELTKEKEQLTNEVDQLKAQSKNKEELLKVEEEFQQEKQKLEAEIKEVQQKINVRNSEVQKSQNENDTLVNEAKQKDAIIQKMNYEMIQKDTEIKKLRAELEGKIVDSYA